MQAGRENCFGFFSLFISNHNDSINPNKSGMTKTSSTTLYLCLLLGRDKCNVESLPPPIPFSQAPTTGVGGGGCEGKGGRGGKGWDATTPVNKTHLKWAHRTIIASIILRDLAGRYPGVIGCIHSICTRQIEIIVLACSGDMLTVSYKRQRTKTINFKVLPAKIFPLIEPAHGNWASLINTLTA